ncbi:MAG: hypothetical protein KIS94_03170 [Chitinophagales bacterium]|nr:hypothetical protein [Chitinophagales bacterium]
MRQTFIAIAVLVLPVLVLSQSRDTVFTVKANTGAVILLPETDVLYKDITWKFKIVKPSGMVIDTVLFTGGTVIRKDSLLLLKPTQTKSALLKIYERNASGKSVLVFIKEFNVVKFTEPKPNLDGVESDSVIQRMRVVAQGYINMPKSTDPALKRISYPIISFEMLDYTNGLPDTLKASGNRMSYDMRDRIDKMQGGSVIEAVNIRYRIGNDTLTTRLPLRVYLADDKISKF